MTYDNVTEALQPVTNATLNVFNDLTLLSNEFVRWNDPNMFFDSGQSRNDVKTQTNYKTGEIIGRNPYFAYVYAGTKNIPAGGRSGKPRPFEYTAKERVKDIEKIEVAMFERALKK